MTNPITTTPNVAVNAAETTVTNLPPGAQPITLYKIHGTIATETFDYVTGYKAKQQHYFYPTLVTSYVPVEANPEEKLYWHYFRADKTEILTLGLPIPELTQLLDEYQQGHMKELDGEDLALFLSTAQDGGVLSTTEEYYYFTEQRDPQAGGAKP